MQTMWVALKICLPVTLMTFAIFTRSDMVVNPGWLQVSATLLVGIGTCATAFAMFGQYAINPAGNMLLRIALAVLAFITMFHPDDALAIAAAAFTLPATVYGVIRHGRISGPTSGLQPQPAS